jgi:hypothetical protein
LGAKSTGAGARPTQHPQDPWPALQPAISFGPKAVPLVKGHIRITCRDIEALLMPWSTVVVAGRPGRAKPDQALAENRPDIHHKDKQGCAALDIAVDAGYGQIVRLLREAGTTG